MIEADTTSLEDEFNPRLAAETRFDEAAARLGLDDGMYKILRTPSREITVYIPIQLDDGRLEVRLLVVRELAPPQPPEVQLCENGLHTTLFAFRFGGDAVGVNEVAVYRPPTVAVLSTGNELVADADKPGPGQIRNSNGPMLKALAMR